MAQEKKLDPKFIDFMGKIGLTMVPFKTKTIETIEDVEEATNFLEERLGLSKQDEPESLDCEQCGVCRPTPDDLGKETDVVSLTLSASGTSAYEFADLIATFIRDKAEAFEISSKSFNAVMNTTYNETLG